MSDIDIHMICHFSRRGRGDANPKRRGIARAKCIQIIGSTTRHIKLDWRGPPAKQPDKQTKKAAQRNAPSATSGASPEAGAAAGAAVPGATEEGGAFLAGAT